jgi:hypothetical protein
VRARVGSVGETVRLENEELVCWEERSAESGRNDQSPGIPMCCCAFISSNARILARVALF